MKRLRGSDAFAIYSETPTSPFVTLKVAIYRPTKAGDVPSFEEVRDFVLDGVSCHSESAAMRIVRVPMDLHHPVWIVDPDFSPENHIFHATLPRPGGKLELCELISDLMSRPLNPDLPPWEVWIVDGLAEGKIAIVSKLHHALADGNTIAAMISDTHSTSPSAHSRKRARPGESIPGRTRLVRDALLDLAKSYTVDLPHYYSYLKQARAHGNALAQGKPDPGMPSSAPCTVLNTSGGSGRVYRYETAPLAEMKALTKQFRCTINALVLGICAEALKRYLRQVDTVPDEPLVAAMPVGALGEEDFHTVLNSDIQHNNVAIATVPLDLAIDDFGERLRHIKQAAEQAIEHVRRSGGRRIDNYLDYLPGTAVRLLHAAMKRLQDKTRRSYANVIISNVKGPGKPLYAVGGRLEMVELLSTGNLQDAGSLNITVWSYVDKLFFSVYTRQEAPPRPELISRCIHEVIEELRAQYRLDGGAR